MTKAIKKAMSIITAIAVMFMAGFVVLPPVARAETLGAFEVTDVSGMYEYKYENGVLTVLSGSAYYSLSIKNTDPNTPTTDRIEIADGVGSMILYLGGVNIDVSALDDTAAIKVNGSSRLYISVEGGKNTLKSGKNCAGIQLNGTDGEISIDASDVNGLTVTGGEGGAGIGGGKGCEGANITVKGVITATGGAGAAGIGGGAGGSGSNITVNSNQYWPGSCIITATGGEYGAGIGGGNGGSGSGITINGSAVVAAGGAGAAGIGGGKGGAGSDITITGGTVTAAGAQDRGSAGAGIGGGADGEGANIMISGGSVKAAAGTGANDIGGGSGKDAVTPTDGLGMVYLAEISNPNSEDVTIDGNAFTPVNHTAADSADTTLYAYLRGGLKHNVTVGSAASTVDLSDKPFSTMDFTISATDAGNAPVEGTDYTYGADSTGAIVLNILTGTPITVANADPSKPTTNRIAVADGVSADVTLAGVNIDVSATSDVAAFRIADDSAGDVTVTLKDGTENTLLSGADCAGLQKNGESGTLIIDGAGKLTAKGSGSGAGIGGGFAGAGANITVRGGTIVASGSEFTSSAGIGGGASGKASNITVSGGTVTATGFYGAGIGCGSYATASGVTISGGTVIAASSRGAGIGGGSYSTGSNITISGGTVAATSVDGAGIGGGKGKDGSDITITGGSVRALSENANAIGGGAGNPAAIPTNGAASVYLLTIKNPDDEAVMIDGGEYTPVNHRAADSADGNLYVYLTAGIHTVKVGDTEKEYDMTDGEYTGSGKNFTVSATNAGETLKYDIDYTYPAEDGVLTVLTDKAITIKNADPDTATTDRIEVSENVSANITLAGVNISSTDNAALRIADSTAADVVITLADGAKNRLQSPDRYAGLQKGNNAGALTINGTGELSATGGFAGAGIGGGYKCVTSKITISGGKVIAAGSGGAAGIGGGYNAGAFNIAISGGTVIATGGDSGNIGGAGIGGGSNRAGSKIIISGGTVTATGGNGAGIGSGDGDHATSVVISGGSVKASSEYGSAIGSGVGGPASIPTDGTDDVLLVTIDNPDDEPVEIDGKPYTPVNHRAADSADGNLYVYLKAGEIHTVKVGGAEKEYDLTGDDYKRGTAFTVSATNEGETLEYGVDYTFPANGTVLTVLTDKAITIKNADPENALRSNCIMVAGGVNANITLAGVNIDISNSSAFRIGNGSGKVTVTLAENTVNILKSGANYAGLHKVSADSTLTINGTGELRAFGGYKGAGIGNGDYVSYGSAAHITINGGTITAAGGEGGAGIGGGNEKSCEDITINGGAVIATGGLSAAGIGGGYSGRGENITVNGGTVTARGGGNPNYNEATHGAGIGGGVDCKGANITINGGSVRAIAGGKNADDIGGGDSAKGSCTPTNGTENVYLLVIANPDDKAVLIDGKEYLPINHKAADSADGSLYAYLTGVNHEVTVGEIALTYAFSADKGEFVQIGLTAPEAVTGLVYDGTERQLITVGSATAGTLVYALEKDGAYSEELPTGIDAGVYTVWYRVEYGDYAGKAESVKVEIAKAQVAEIAFTIGAPAAGEALDTAAQAVGAEYALSPAKWKPADVTARYDAVYTVTVTAELTDARNYRFADSVTAAVNGAAANAEDNGGSVTISYTFPKTAKAGLTGITVTPPAKLEYIVGESVDVTGGKLVLSYQDGTTEELALAADMLSYDNAKAGAAAVTVTYGGFTDSFEVTFAEPTRETVQQPVISPNGGTFSGSQQVTITCATQGAQIYYTTDGTAPTAAAALYTAPFTISDTATVKAIALKDGMNDSAVAQAKFTKKTDGGNTGDNTGDNTGGSPSGRVNGGPSTETKPAINSKAMGWADAAKEINGLTSGSEITIELNGSFDVPADVIKAIADRKIKATFVIDGYRSWLIDGAHITAPTAANLRVITLGKLDTTGLRGTAGYKFSLSGTNNPTTLVIAFNREHAGRFANLYKTVDGSLAFAGVVKVDENGNASFPDARDKGDYVIMLGDYSDLHGDANNDGAVDIADALALLRDVFGVEAARNAVMRDYNGDGRFDIADARDMLKDVFYSRA